MSSSRTRNPVPRHHMLVYRTSQSLNYPNQLSLKASHTQICANEIIPKNKSYRGSIFLHLRSSRKGILEDGKDLNILYTTENDCLDLDEQLSLQRSHKVYETPELMYLWLVGLLTYDLLPHLLLCNSPFQICFIRVVVIVGPRWGISWWIEGWLSPQTPATFDKCVPLKPICQ